MDAFSTFEPPRFRENQRFARGWLWLVVLATAPVVVMQAYGTYRQFVLGLPFGNHPASDQGLLWLDLMVAVLCGSTIWLFAAVRLEVRVTRELLDVNFFPVRHKRIPLVGIATAYVRGFSPMLEYGGWGLRWSVLGNGWGYFLRGSQGVQLVLRNGTKMLVGSRDPEQLLVALRQAQPSIAPDKPMFTEGAAS